MTMKMPEVLECTVDSCVYNTNKGCHAMAITVGDPGGEPSCDTFFTADKRGGVMETTAGVGACKLGDCKFNQDFECSADSITVGRLGGQADCMTYEAS